MLVAHANMPIEDFISQLRTYVIAMGLSPMVVDCVDKLVDPDELQNTHEKELQETEDRIAKETKDDILQVVNASLDEYGEFSEAQRNSLLNAIESV